MRRFRLLFAAGAIVLLAVFGAAQASSAEGEPGSEEEITHAAEVLAEENGGSEFDAHCIALLTEGKSVDDCQAAPNPLLPETNEIIWGGLGFLVVFGLLWWKALPSVKAGMNARTERIAGDLEAAETQRTEAEAVLAEYKAQLADARAESARIIEEARQAADEVRSNLQAKAEADIAELRARAQADIESAKVQAVADLRGEVTALAIGAAEQVVGRNLDQETNAALVEAYINSVGAQS